MAAVFAVYKLITPVVGLKLSSVALSAATDVVLEIDKTSEPQMGEP